MSEKLPRIDCQKLIRALERAAFVPDIAHTRTAHCSLHDEYLQTTPPQTANNRASPSLPKIHSCPLSSAPIPDDPQLSASTAYPLPHPHSTPPIIAHPYTHTPSSPSKANPPHKLVGEIDLA